MKLLTERQYMLYRFWPIIWVGLIAAAIWFWGSLGTYIKIAIAIVLAITAPDSPSDLFKPYSTYKKELEKTMGDNKLTPRDERTTSDDNK